MKCIHSVIVDDFPHYTDDTIISPFQETDEIIKN